MSNPQLSVPADHDHHGGYAADLKVLNRRRALGLFGAASTAAILTACGGEGSTSSASSSTSTGGTSSGGSSSGSSGSTSSSASGSGATCVSYAQETNGPYPADGTNRASGYTSNVVTQSDFQRSDIRNSVSTGNETPGIPLTFTITLTDVNNSCAALEGYAIYIWHCDASGDYSLYDIPAEDYLRGIQTTNANGQVTFTTIVPGCYNGRYPHIHFEVFSSITNATTGAYAVLISQFAVPKDVLSGIYASDTRYTSSIAALNNISISSDNVFGNNSDEQIAAMTMEMSGSISAGYTATATVGIAT